MYKVLIIDDEAPARIAISRLGPVSYTHLHGSDHDNAESSYYCGDECIQKSSWIFHIMKYIFYIVKSKSRWKAHNICHDFLIAFKGIDSHQEKRGKI